MLTTAILHRKQGIGAVRSQSNLNAYQGDEGSESEFGEHVDELVELLVWSYFLEGAPFMLERHQSLFDHGRIAST